MDIVEFLAVWAVVSVVVGLVVGSAMYRMGNRDPVDDPGLIENVLPPEALADDFQPQDRLVS